MSARRTSFLRRISLLTALASMAVAPVRAGAASGTPAPAEDLLPLQVRVYEPALAAAVWRAVKGADALLDEPGCRQVFEAFADEDGESLASVLRDRGETGRGHLSQVFFYGGVRHPACQIEGRVAVTEPGSAVVVVCTPFGRLGPRLARAVVIHELLHTLGLGENPPTSAEITDAVLQQCWN